MVKMLFLSVMAMIAPLSAAEPTIAIQPLGKMPAAQVEKVKAGILALYAMKVEVLPAKPLPKEAYYEPRERYKADKLLDLLDQETGADFTKVIGLTTQDISSRKGEIADWGIFGLGQLGGRACVVSTYRLHAGKASEPVFQSRLAKVSIHELGHTFGLDHCPNTGCFMNDGAGKIATVDAESDKPCPDCAAKLPLAHK